ncbi:MAG TPA: PEP-CTERM sorting domain-containing protein, partial [Verrucomicrobiae bacterium]|nr:PEP-CTERM sorting domain-containing protein [Verrucomicrobiae bacterium]
MRSHFLPASTGTKTIRNQILSSAAIACATGVTALMPNIGAAQVAYDSAGNSTYGSGWSAGQNGGSGFGAWSFDGTTSPGGVSDPGGQQEISSAGAIGKAWTLYNLTPGSGQGSGISDVGRSISEAGGLQIGQTFETVLQNPSVSGGYYTYTGWDILFGNNTDNNAAGNNTSAIRAQVFNYYNSAQNWSINDSTYSSHSHATSMTGPTTAAAGVKLDLTLTSATTYQLTMTPLNGAASYTLDSTYSGPINYINYRLYNTASSGPSDVADNFGISYMEIQAVPEPASVALFGMGLSGLFF